MSVVYVLVAAGGVMLGIIRLRRLALVLELLVVSVAEDRCYRWLCQESTPQVERASGRLRARLCELVEELGGTGGEEAKESVSDVCPMRQYDADVLDSAA